MAVDGFRRDLLKALLIVWLILGAASGAAVLAPLAVRPDLLFSVFPLCPAKAAGGSCFLCGMTTAFVNIGSGDLDSARTANGSAITVYSLLALNFLSAAAYTIGRVVRHANS